MGLDSVEYVMAIEEEFEISISDEDASKLTTSLEVAEYIAKRFNISIPRNNKFIQQQEFARLKKILVNELKIEPHVIHPKALITEIFSNNLRSDWKQLRKLMNNKYLPQPKLTNSIQQQSQKLFLNFSLISSGLLFFYLSPFHPLISFIVAVISFSVIYCIIQAIMEDIADQPPLYVTTLQELLPYMFFFEVKEIDHNSDLTFENILQRVLIVKTV